MLGLISFYFLKYIHPVDRKRGTDLVNIGHYGRHIKRFKIIFFIVWIRGL